MDPISVVVILANGLGVGIGLIMAEIVSGHIDYYCCEPRYNRYDSPRYYLVR